MTNKKSRPAADASIRARRRGSGLATILRGRARSSTSGLSPGGTELRNSVWHGHLEGDAA